MEQATKARSARWTFSIVSFNAARSPQIAQRPSFVPDGKAARSMYTPKLASFQNTNKQGLAGGYLVQQIAPEQWLKKKDQKNEFEVKKDHNGWFWKFIIVNRLLYPVIWKKRSECNACQTTFASIACRGKKFPCCSRHCSNVCKTHKGLVQIGIQCNRLYPHFCLLEAQAGFNIVSRAFLQKEWSTGLKYQSIANLFIALKEPIELLGTILIFVPIGDLNVKV